MSHGVPQIQTAWSALGKSGGGAHRLFTVVVLRDPATRLFSAFIHGKQFKMRNQV